MTCRGELSSRWFRFGFRMLSFCADVGLAAFAVKHHLLRVQVELPHQLPDRGPDAAGGTGQLWGLCHCAEAGKQHEHNSDPAPSRPQAEHSTGSARRKVRSQHVWPILLVPLAPQLDLVGRLITRTSLQHTHAVSATCIVWFGHTLASKPAPSCNSCCGPPTLVPSTFATTLACLDGAPTNVQHPPQASASSPSVAPLGRGFGGESTKPPDSLDPSSSRSQD